MRLKKNSLHFSDTVIIGIFSNYFEFLFLFIKFIFFATEFTEFRAFLETEMLITCFDIRVSRKKNKKTDEGGLNDVNATRSHATCVREYDTPERSLPRHDVSQVTQRGFCVITAKFYSNTHVSIYHIFSFFFSFQS